MTPFLSSTQISGTIQCFRILGMIWDKVFIPREDTGFFFLMSIFFLNHLIIGLNLEVNWEHFEGMTLILSNFLFISQRVLGEKSKSSSKITKIKQNNKNRLSLENKKTRHFLWATKGAIYVKKNLHIWTEGCINSNSWRNPHPEVNRKTSQIKTTMMSSNKCGQECGQVRILICCW